MKAKLKARRRRKAREQNPTAAARAKYGNSNLNDPQNIFEEIKDLLKEEERSKSTRWGDVQRQDNDDREQKFYTRSYDGSSTTSRSRVVEGDPHSPINKVMKELQSLEMKINLDQRDWGDVTDQELIEERLRDLYDM